MPVHVQIPEARTIAALRLRLLVGRARILRQALLDQLYQRLVQALRVLVRFLEKLAAP